MKREPSIHITKASLTEVFRTMGHGYYQSASFADEVFHYAKPYSLHTRTITVSNDRMEKKAKKLVGASRRDADQLARLIYVRRQTLKHRGITQMKPGDRDWPLLKGVTAHALDFTNEFGLPRRYGFIKYVEVGLSKMKKFSINKFPGMYQGICETYQAMVEIEKDDDREMTKDMYNIYSRRIIESTGVHDTLEELPERYVWFVRARKQAEQMNVSVGVYMRAQFAGFDFAKGIPHPVQLVGPKATQRVIRYCYEEGIKVNK